MAFRYPALPFSRLGRRNRDSARLLPDQVRLDQSFLQPLSELALGVNQETGGNFFAPYFK